MIHFKNSNSHEVTNLAIPDLTSMLDIFFILLFFLMMIVGSVFQTLTVTLPESLSNKLSLIKTEQNIILEIANKGYTLDGKFFKSFSNLKSEFPRLKKEKAKHKLMIAGEKNLSLEKFLQVLNYLQSQNITIANILMQKNTSP